MEKMLMLGTSLASEEMIKYAQSQGVYTIVTDYLPPEKSTAKLISDEYWMINTGELDVLETKCREEGVTAVICGVSEFNLEMSMELCKRLGLQSYCTPEAWHYSRDKADFKKLCHEVDAPVADDYYLSDALTDEELDKVKFPVVVKPVDMSGNRGITYCYNKQELIDAYKYARSLSKNPKIVVERMLKGREWYSYYALAEGTIHQIGLVAMECMPEQLKNLYSLSTTVTDNVERFMAEINPKIEEVLHKVGCREGIAWVQVMLDEDDHFYIIEMGYRPTGDRPEAAFPDLNGFDEIKWLVDYARGIKHKSSDLPPIQWHSYKNCCCGYSLWTHKGGTLKSFNGFEEICNIPGIKFYTQHHVGETFPEHRPLGVVGVYADTIDEFCEKIEKINKTISILDENDEDVIIRYTDFDHIRELYNNGIKQGEESSVTLGGVLE
ncbi:MAG: ATP-grasp domain-containing protein [Ruminococcus sp.]|nr:ATP-grasp domain-containing protein [Ruminococcus sp.]